MAVVLAGEIDAVLVAGDLPELGTDLVAALATLDVQNFSHGWARNLKEERDLGIWIGE